MSGENQSAQEVTALLVSYAAGTATEQERKEVEAMAENDKDVAARLALATSSKTALQSAKAKEEEDWTPGELGFRRLMRDIEREEKAAPDLSKVKWIDSLAVWRAVAAVAAIGLVAVSVWRFDGATRDPAGGYVPATGGAEVAAAAQITFANSATEAQIRGLLLDTGARLIDGPSALGVYRAAFESKEARDAAIERMKSAQFVESVGAE